jgi:hypothetical protein
MIDEKKETCGGWPTLCGLCKGGCRLSIPAIPATLQSEPSSPPWATD